VPGTKGGNAQARVAEVVEGPEDLLVAARSDLAGRRVALECEGAPAVVGGVWGPDPESSSRQYLRAGLSPLHNWKLPHGWVWTVVDG